MNQNTIELSNKDGKETVVLNVQNLKKSIFILKAAQHKLRSNMLKYISDKQPITVTQLYTHFRLEQSAASQHLAIMRRAGLVSVTRDGKFIYYSINIERIKEFNIATENLIK